MVQKKSLISALSRQKLADLCGFAVLHHVSWACYGELEFFHLMRFLVSMGTGEEWGKAGNRVTLKSPARPSYTRPPSGCLSSGSRSFFLSRAPSLVHTFAHAVPLCWEPTPHLLYPTHAHKTPHPRVFLSNAHQAKSNSP